jgi:hypothetical protein
MRFHCLVVALTIASAAAASTDDVIKEVGRSVRTIQTAFNKGDKATLETLMTPDHFTVLSYASFSSAAAQLKVLSEFQFSDYVIGGLEVKPLSDDVALVRYRASIKGTYRDKPVPSPVHVTQVWIKRRTTWLQAAYVETPVQNR